MKNTPPKILVIEDEVAVLDLLIEALTKEGLAAIGARDGEEGLRMALTEHPQFILLDLILPKKDGFTVLTELRRDEWGKACPVAILTNVSDHERMKEVLQYGVTDIWLKTDWKLKDLIQTIKKKAG